MESSVRGFRTIPSYLGLQSGTLRCSILDKNLPRYVCKKEAIPLEIKERYATSIIIKLSS